MPEQNPVYEIAEMLSNQQVLQQDVLISLQQHCKEKYLDKMKQTVSVCYENAKASPCREVRLISAMKEFMPEGYQENLDQLIHTFTAMQVYGDMRKSFLDSRLNRQGVETASVETVQDASIHTDGIYDVDNACLIQRETRKADALSTLMMMVFMHGK